MLGDITGVNPGDSKFLGSTVNLVSHEGTVRARRLRCDDCYIKSKGPVSIGSYVEAQTVQISTPEFVQIGKRMGVAETGTIWAKGFKAGSIFSNMAKLPEKR